MEISQYLGAIFQTVIVLDCQKKNNIQHKKMKPVCMNINIFCIIFMTIKLQCLYEKHHCLLILGSVLKRFTLMHEFIYSL